MAKVLMVAHWDWVLFNFRIPMARMLERHGYEVVFVCPFGEYVPRLQQMGFRCVHWSVVRQSVNPIQELTSILHLAHIYRGERPDIVHHFTIKPNLYGSLAATLLKKQRVPLKVINTFTGLGFLFSSHLKANLLRLITLPFMRLTWRQQYCWAVFLNHKDLQVFLQMRLVNQKQTKVIISDGIDTELFCPNGHLSSDYFSSPIVLMASRLLWDKGIREFVEAARLLKERGVEAEFWLAGRPDNGNPVCVPEEVLQEWQREGVIHWLGHCDDMPSLLRRVHIAVLPSYHEGVPRFLLEAAATGLPLVATDIEGCRVVVRNGVNGFLVPVRDPHALADAIEKLVKNPELRRQMGKASRQIVEAEFDERRILAQWLQLYEEVLRQ